MSSLNLSKFVAGDKFVAADIQTNAMSYYKVNYRYTSMSQLEKVSHESESRYRRQTKIDNGTISEHVWFTFWWLVPVTSE